MDDQILLPGGIQLPVSEVRFRTSRSSGPGGQHANVTASRVEAVFDVQASAALDQADRERLMAKLGPQVVAVAQDFRSQARNRELALERLERRLASALTPERPRRPTRRPRASVERRLEAKRRQAERKRARRGPAPDQ